MYNWSKQQAYASATTCVAKKIFLNGERAIPTVQVSSVSWELSESQAASALRNSLGSDSAEELPFMILDETSKFFSENLIQPGVLC
jgi:hypothetical protein